MQDINEYNVKLTYKVKGIEKEFDQIIKASSESDALSKAKNLLSIHSTGINYQVVSSAAILRK